MRRHISAAFLFIFLSTLIIRVHGQDCEALTQDVGCTQFGLDAGSMVFVADKSLAELEGTVSSFIGGVNFVTTIEPCRSLLVRMICVTYLRPCVNTSSGYEPIPVQNCRYQCDQFARECQIVYDLFGQPLGAGIYFPPNTTFPLSCTETDFYAQDQPFWPDTQNSYSWNNATLDVPCNNLTGVPILVPIDCAEGLSYDASNGGCSFTCTLPALTDSEYYNAKVMQGVLGWFSWAGTCILIFCYLVNPVLRRFPRNMILMCAIAANVAAGAIILPTMVGYFNIWCGGSTQYIKPSYSFPTQGDNSTATSADYVISFENDALIVHSSACTFQGAMLQFGYLSATFWWGLIALNIFLEVYFSDLLKLESTWPKWVRIVCYQVIGWGVPFLFMVIPAAADRIGFAPGATYCFVTDEDDQAYLLTFWIIPVAITLFFAFLFFCLALIKIVIVMISLRKFKDLLRYGRLLVFIFLYLFLFCFIFSYNIQIEANSDTITDGYSKYFKCLSDEGTGACPQSEYLSDEVTNYNLIMLKGFAISVLGFLLFLIFMSFEVMKFWYLVGKSLVLLALKRNRAQAMVLVNLFLYARTQMSTLEGTDTTLTVTDTGMEEDDDVIDRKSQGGSESDKTSASDSSSDDVEMEDM